MKKGFTLIELLAVIVILAIIALIAVPIILEIINNSKENSLLRSAEFYMDSVEIAVSRKKLSNNADIDGTYLINEDGNLCKQGLLCLSDNTIVVEMNGTKPTSGKIVIENGEIVVKNSDQTEETSIVIENNTIKYNEENNLIISNEILIESVTIDYSACDSSKYIPTEGCAPVITITPSNATNKKLDFTLSGVYYGCENKTYAVGPYVQIGSSTGIIKPTSEYGDHDVGTLNLEITATTKDGSKISTTVNKSFPISGFVCGWY